MCRVAFFYVQLYCVQFNCVIKNALFALYGVFIYSMIDYT
nr:MAG TPA: hypothetical protein [Caudoviricetes sp.]